MTDFLLTADEALLARRATEGEPCDFSDRSADGNPAVEIRAEAIRRLLIGLPVKFDAGGFAERVTIPGPGLRLKSALVTGEWRLDDATAIDGGACPPLALEDCVIPEPIYLARAHLRRLSLSGSRIVHLCAPNLRLEGPLELTSITSAEAEGATTGAHGEGRCWVELQNAKVDGDVVARGAQLVAKADGAVDGAAETASNYALDLRGARVTDAVDLTPIGSRFRAVGRVMLANGEIGGNLRLDGAELSGRLIAQGVTIGGDALLTTSGEHRFKAVGDIWLIGAKISGNLEMDGAELSGELFADGVTVGGSAFLRASGEHPFTVAGYIHLYGAKISGSLIMYGAQLSGAADFTNAIVTGTMSLGVKSSKSDKSLIPFFVLRGASVGALEDDGGRGFPAGVRLILDGFKYGGLEPHETTERSILSRAQRRLAQVPFAVWAGWFLVLGAVGVFGLDIHAAWGPAALVAAVLGLVIGLFGTVDLGHTRATERLAWLNKQYVRGNVKASPDLYTPEPYERLIKHFRTSGHYRDAWRVASERLTIENGVQTSRPLRFAMSLFHLFFDYGLSPVHALSTFTVCILLGWGAVTIADQGFAQRLPFEAELSRAGISAPHIKPVLELSAQPVSTLATKDGAHIGLVRVATPVSHIPCGGEIEPLLYAIDNFIPAIDLDQRNRCSVSTDDGALWWRIGRAAYTLLGWIVTSLTILTLSGILRRQAET